MEASIVQHETAIQFGERTVPLAEIVDPRHLLNAPHQIVDVAAGSDDLIVTLADGSRWAAFPRVRPARRLIVHNISQLLTMTDAALGVVYDSSIVCEFGKIVAIVPGHAVPESARDDHTAVVDAQGGVVSPGLIDPHTHPVFAGSRHVEYGLKARGASYLEIHKAGGGILSTVRATRTASFETLLGRARESLTSLMRWGVTTCEAKSGYALDVFGELRLLEVLRAASNGHPMDVVPTLLGAHAIPEEHAQDRAAYVELIVQEMIPQAAVARLARYCDAYLEDGAFTVAEVERIFTAARQAGLGLRLHAEQFTDQGGASLAARLGAASADHLEHISAAGIAALAQAKTTAVLLPWAALSCRCPLPPARALLDGGVNVALGTDLNPGSSFTAALPAMMSFACTQVKMSCEEAWLAVTRRAAESLGIADRVGSLAPGMQADLAIHRAPDYRYVPYSFGENTVQHVVKAGRLVF